MVAVRAVWLVVGVVAPFGSVVSFLTMQAADGTTYRAVDCHSFYLQMACECNVNIVAEDFGCKYSNPNLALEYLWLMIALWGSAVTVNVVAAAVAESVASWWSSPSPVEPVWNSFHRVMSSSLG